MIRYIAVASVILIAANPRAHAQAPIQIKQVAPVTRANSVATPETRSAAALAQSAAPVFDKNSAARIRTTIEVYRKIAMSGGWPLIAPDTKGLEEASDESTDVLRRRLIASNDLAESNANLSLAIKRFQARHGLPETGKVGPRTLAALNIPADKRLVQLEAALQRIEALGFQFGNRYVVVNIPAAFVEAIENDKVVRRYRVIVGKSDKPSPTVTSEITDINLNPNWTVPSSITKNEIAAHMRKDPTYLDRMHMQLFDARNQIVDPSKIDWSDAKALNITVRQLPGEWNALGRLKINMPNPYAVYMHDTNQKTLFSKDYRFESHGCARVDNVRDLAAWLMDDTPYWDRSTIDEAISSGDRIDIKLTNKVPVAWIYLTAWVTHDGMIQFRNDIYDQDEQLLEASVEEPSFFEQATHRHSGAKAQ